jgi:heme/copper-type cytochrome/quinol oxidase subunit 3
MVLFICTEAATFACAIASYFYLRFVHATGWPPASDKLPHLVLPTVATVVLVVSCVPMALSLRAARRGRGGATGAGVLLALAGGAAFVVLQILDWRAEWPASTLQKDAYGSLFFSITGLHTLHVLIGLGMLVFLLVSVAIGRITTDHWDPVTIVSMYWYFMSVLAVAVYATVYLSPYA